MVRVMRRRLQWNRRRIGTPPRRRWKNTKVLSFGGRIVSGRYEQEPGRRFPDLGHLCHVLGNAVCGNGRCQGREVEKHGPLSPSLFQGLAELEKRSVNIVPVE